MEVRNGAALWLLMLVPVLAVFLLVAYRRSRRDLDRLAGAWRFGALSTVLLVKTFFSSLLIVLFFVWR